MQSIGVSRTWAWTRGPTTVMTGWFGNTISPSRMHRTEVLAEFAVLLSGEELLIELLGLGAEFEDHLDDLLRAAHDSPVVVLRRLAVKEIENCYFFLLATVQIGLSHSVLVLVRDIGFVDFIDCHNAEDVYFYKIRKFFDYSLYL